MATYGYVRKNFPTSEVEQLTKLLTYNCDELFFEGKSLLETSELKAMIEKLEKNDLVVVTHLHVFGQELQHLRPVISFFQENGIRLISIDDQVDTNRDSFFYPLFDIFSKMDADCREELEKQQYVTNPQETVDMGRPSIQAETIKKIYMLYHEQNWNMRRIAEECNVSLGSVSKYTKMSELHNNDSLISR